MPATADDRRWLLAHIPELRNSPSYIQNLAATGDANDNSGREDSNMPTDYGTQMKERSGKISSILQGLQNSYSPRKFLEPDVEAQIPTDDQLSDTQADMARGGETYIPSRESMAENVRHDIFAQNAAERAAQESARNKKMSDELSQAATSQNPIVKKATDESEAFKLRLAGEPSRVAGQTQADVAHIYGGTQRDLQRGAQDYDDRVRSSGGVSGGAVGASGMPGKPTSTGRGTTPTMHVATNKALDTAVKDARGTGSASGGLLGSLRRFIPGMGGGNQPMEVDPAKMDAVVSHYQNAMVEQGIPGDVQEAAIALVTKYPGMSAEEKIKHLQEIGYDPAQISPQDHQTLVRALRMTGGL